MNNDIKKLNSNDSEKIYKSIIKNIRQSNAEVLIFSENNYPYLVKNLNDLGLNSFLKHNLMFGVYTFLYKNYIVLYLLHKFLKLSLYIYQRKN